MAPPSPGQRRRTAFTPTIRLRLTALYGTVFLISGAILLTIGYLFVRSNLRTHHSLRAELIRLHFRPAHGAYGFPAGSPEAKLIHIAESQIIGGALHQLLYEYIAALLVMTAISVLAGWLLAGRALAPLRRITATARRVSVENLAERIALPGPADELRELADTFDGMLGRLDTAFASQRHFVANASHELRTPLAIMRTEIDVALSDPDASRAELREMGEAVREAVDRSEALIASLLLLARSQGAIPHAEPVDLAALAADCVTDLRARADEGHVTVSSELDAAWCSGDPGLLERLIANLLDNAIRHNVDGGTVRVATRRGRRGVVLTVTNDGAPIDPARLPELTEPFRRLDRTTEGFGLGLSIVRSIAEAHGGSAQLTAPPDGGLSVTVRLPASPAAAPPAALPAAEPAAPAPGSFGHPRHPLMKS